MRRRTFVAGTIAASVATIGATISRAQSWSLVTQQEFDREWEESRKGDPNASARPLQPQDASAPKIDIRQPDATKPIKAPVNIIITFVANPDAKIVLSSFRVVYGTFLKRDITDRIKANAQLDEAGLRAERVVLPAGNHSVTISIADDHQRVASRGIQFTVV